jgi:hypothetical protein
MRAPREASTFSATTHRAAARRSAGCQRPGTQAAIHRHRLGIEKPGRQKQRGGQAQEVHRVFEREPAEAERLEAVEAARVLEERLTGGWAKAAKQRAAYQSTAADKRDEKRDDLASRQARGDDLIAVAAGRREQADEVAAIRPRSSEARCPGM